MTPGPTQLTISLHQIEVSDRLRPVDTDWVEALCVSMEEHGLDHPIVVRHLPRFEDAGEGEPLYSLVAGAHRYAAAQRLGWEAIRCEVHALNGVQARLVEIDENLMRRELGALDRAIFLAERKKLWEEIHPETAHGKAKKPRGAAPDEKSQTLRLSPERFSKEAAQKTGLSERSIQLAIELATSLAPEALQFIRSTPLANNAAQLKRLAHEKPEDQVRLARVIAAGEASNLQGARVLADLDSPPARDPQEAILTKLVDLYSRASAKTRRRFEEHVGLLASSDPGA